MRLSLFYLLRPRTAKARLAAIFMATTTVLMGVFGVASYHLAQQRLAEQKSDLVQKLEKHLAQPVAIALWNYDRTAMFAALDSELGGSVLGLAIRTPNGALYAQRGEPPPAATQKSYGDIEVLSFALPMVEGHPVGAIQVTWSDAGMKRALNETGWLAVAQLVGLNAALLIILWIGVDRLIFRRVRLLQQALDAASSRDHAADIAALPVTTRDEFGAITQSINNITRRLEEELDAGRESEEEARAALTNLQNAQQGLVQAEKMASLGSLVAGVAHELNTPIGNIVMVASTQQEVALQLEQAVGAGTLSRSALTSFVTQTRESAALVMHSAQRAADLIQNFKQVAVDQTSDRLRRFDLAEQIAEVLSVILHLLKQKPISLQRDLEPGIDMLSYPGPLGQVVTNLVMNAVIHGFAPDQPGTVTIICKRSGDYAEVTVTDNGMGIHPDNMGKIFDPFFTTKLGQGGSGLGLHICHNMVHGPLGGRLSVQSTVGQGTTFTMLLPLQVPAAS